MIHTTTMSQKPLTTERRLELWDAGPIWEKLPIKFSNGKSWEEFHAHCAFCKKQILDEDFCGDVRETFRDIFRLEGVGFCWYCRKSTISICDVKPDMIKVMQADGSWSVFMFRRTPWSMIRAFASKLTGGRL